MKPVLFSCFKNYNSKKFFQDIIAGIIVGIIAIPLSIALSIASGASPEVGLFSAFIGGLVVCLFGGCRVQISGPTGALVVIVYNVISKFGFSGLFQTTFIAGIILILLGLFKIGSMIKFIPFPITIGFTAGIAVTIFTGQIKDFFGFNIESMPVAVLQKIITYIKHLNTINLTAVAIGVLSVIIIILWSKVTKIIPGYIIALIVSTLLTSIFKLKVETIGSRFGDISTAFPMPAFPQFTFYNLEEILPFAISLAFLASITSLLSAVVVDGITGDKHDSNMELIGQGIGNIVISIFGGLPVTGAVARSCANVKNGGTTPVSAVVQSVLVLLCIMVFMPLAKMIPMSSLAGILFIVCYNMLDKKGIKELFKSPKSDILTMFSVFLLAIVFDLNVAVQMGILLAALLFIKRTVDHFELSEVEKDSTLIPAVVKEKISIYKIKGPFFFGAAHKFLKINDKLSMGIEVIMIDMEHVSFIDATALHALTCFADKCKENNIALYIIGAKGQSLMAMGRSGFLRCIGANYLYDTVHQAIEFGFEPLKEVI